MVLTEEEEEEISKFFADDATKVSISEVKDPSGFQGCYSSLRVEGSSSKWFVKSVPDGDAVVDEFYGRLGIFVKEVKIYRLLFPRMARRGKVWPDCVLAKEGRYLVMEDMAGSGWRTSTSMDEAHVAVALRGFARFHSSSMSILTDADTSTEFADVAVETMLSAVPGSPGRRMWDSFSAIARRIREVYLPESDVDPFPVFQSVVGVVNGASGFQKCLNHGDPWMNNILFKYESDVPLEAAFVDFQSARLAPPALDVVIFLNVFQPERVEHLASVYYDRLEEISLERNVRCPSRREFLDSVKYFERAGKCVAALYIFLTKLPAEYMSKILADQRTFVEFALGENYSVVWDALKNDAEYRDVLCKYLLRAISDG